MARRLSAVLPTRALPDPLTRLIGRDDDVVQLKELLGRWRGCVVTIVGPGGCGKTRLALEVAHQAEVLFDDAAVFVGLADLDDPGRVPTEIGRALGLIDGPGEEPTQRLITALRSLRVLVVVDNLEHLIGAAPVLAELAAQCPESAVLATSRRRLNLVGERIVELRPLAVPPPINDTVPKGLGDVASVQLFCERAAAVNPNFPAHEYDLRPVGEICRLVDGLPLAIELVAAHVRLLPPEGLLARLQRTDAGLTFLDRGPADADARHRNLRDTIAWSYDLLGAAAARLFTRLAVFREGWTLDAMEAVCGAGFDTDELFDAVVELVDLHLVDPVAVTGTEPRYRLLETVRRFATEALGRNGEAEETADRHAEYFADFAIHAGKAFESPDLREWAGLIDRELPNIRAALDHLATVGRPGDSLAAAAALGAYWLDRGKLREGREWLDRFLPSAHGSAARRAVVEGWSVRLAVELGDVSSLQGEDPYEQLARAREVLDRAGEAWEWLRLTDHMVGVLRVQGRFELADKVLAEAVERYQTPDTAWLRAELLRRRTVIAFEGSVEERFLPLAEETMRVARLARNERVQARTTLTLALAPSFPMSDARAEVENSFHVAQEIGDRRGAAMSAAVATRLALDASDLDESARWLLTALDLGVTSGYWHALAWSLASTVELAARTGHQAEAARLHGAVSEHLGAIGNEITPAMLASYRDGVEALRDRLGVDFETECRRGQLGGMKLAMEEARRVTADLTPGEDDTAHPAGRPRGPRANPELTERERDVLRQLADGHSNEQIAELLGVSPKTVMHHTGSVYRKLAVRGRAEAVALALRNGLVA